MKTPNPLIEITIHALQTQLFERDQNSLEDLHVFIDCFFADTHAIKTHVKRNPRLHMLRKVNRDAIKRLDAYAPNRIR